MTSDNVSVKSTQPESFSRDIFLAALTGILLTLSFPNFSQSFLAWYALIPLLWAVNRSRSLAGAMGLGFVSGFVFYLTSVYWLCHVTVFGCLFVVCLETSFMMLFCGFVFDGRRMRHLLIKPLWVALAWTLMEWFRAEIPVFGFGWNLIAYSQSENLHLIQIANIIGAYGLGFVIAFVNACLFEILLLAVRLRDMKRSSVNQEAESREPRDLKRRIQSLALIGILLLIVITVYGIRELRERKPAQKTFRISVIQGNIPQEVKWEVVAREKIIQIYLRLTELASYDNPDLILWPEAAFPGYLNRDVEKDRVEQVVERIQTPTVVGSPHYQDIKTVFNSAYLLNQNGEPVGRYDKLFLVPFGEYVPLKNIFGWLEPIAYTLGVSDFSAGNTYTVFRVKDQMAFSVLICFEDVFPAISRRFVDRGAEFLAVITNDAWFKISAAPYQHMQASVFRAVENGVSVVRAANTGVSAFIDSKGAVLDRLRAKNGNDIFVAGRKTYPLPIQVKSTLYRKGGYLFPYAALILMACLVLMDRLKRKKLSA